MRANENERKVTSHNKSLRVVWGLPPRAAFAIALMVGVSGCASHRETFDCAPGAGVGCKSISQVNDMIDHTGPQGDWSQAGLSQTPASTFVDTSVADTSVLGTNVPPLDLVPVAPTGAAHAGVLKVWVAPFTDEEGNFHEAALIHIPQTSLPQGDLPHSDLSQDGDSR